MPEKPKPDRLKDEEPDDIDERSWGEDQKKHRYYYDDAHGYEVFNPEDEDSDRDED